MVAMVAEKIDGGPFCSIKMIFDRSDFPNYIITSWNGIVIVFTVISKMDDRTTGVF